MEHDRFPDATSTAVSSTDEQLLLDYLNGAPAAFAAIVERHENRLARIAFRIIGCRSEAEDTRHAVFVRFLQLCGSQPRQFTRVGAWLTRCTVNEAISRVRKQNREGRVRAEFATLVPAAGTSSPLEQVEAEESRERLSIALAELSPDARAILSLRFDEDLTFREIAVLLDRPPSTVKSQLAKAIAQLRDLLGAAN